MTSPSFSRGEPFTRVQIDTMFTTMAAVRTSELVGLWTARYVGIEAEQTPLLAGKGWYGMRFTDDDNVDTLLCRSSDGELFAADPAAVATAIAEDVPDVTAIRSRVEATDPVACMRMVEYRGTLSAAIIYKRQPIIDYLRRIDDNTVLGAVELIGQQLTKYFVLSRAS